MKNLLALILAAFMLMSFVACSGPSDDEKGNDTDKTEQTTNNDKTTNDDQTTLDDTKNETPKLEGVAAPVDVLNAIWAKYADDQKFFAMGGDFSNLVDNAPGAYSLADKDSLAAQLICKGDAANSVAEAASLIHAMNANTFTGAAYKLTEGADMDAFLTAIKSDIQGNQWICGFPEKLLTAKISGEYVVVAFGNGEIIETFKTNLVSAYSFVEPTVDTIG